MNNTTAVSGSRSVTQSMRQEAPRGLGRRVPTHLIILALAGVLWWIARDMVATTRPLADIADVQFIAAEELKGQWRIVSPPTRKVGLEVSGPTREINNFEREVRSNPSRYSYTFRITAAELQGLIPDGRHQVILEVEAGRFQLGSDVASPSELTIKLASGDRRYQVVLEQFITRAAVVDTGGITGTAGRYTYDIAVPADPALEVHGPASSVEAITRNNVAFVPVASTRIENILDNRSRRDRVDVDALLKQGSLVAQLPLVPPPEIEIRRADKGGPVGEVSVEFTFRERRWIPRQEKLKVQFRRAFWMEEKGVKLTVRPQELTVTLEVSEDTQANFPAAVKLYISLENIREDDAGIVKQDRRRTLKIKGGQLWFALDVDREQLTFRFLSDNLKANEYLQVLDEVVLEWEEP